MKCEEVLIGIDQRVGLTPGVFAEVDELVNTNLRDRGMAREFFMFRFLYRTGGRSDRNRIWGLKGVCSAHLGKRCYFEELGGIYWNFLLGRVAIAL